MLNQAYNNAQRAIPQPMNEANLITTPGYQFNLSQGLRAAQNSAAAKGLGVSGAALTGASQYATGLADNTYQQQFANQQTLYNDANNQYNNAANMQNNIFNQLSAPVTMGENAAATSGSQGIQSASNIGNAAMQAGNAQAAGITGSSNAIASGINSAGNSVAGMAYLYNQNALNSPNATAPAASVDTGTWSD